MTNPDPRGWPPPVVITDAKLSETRRLLRYVSAFYVLMAFVTLGLAGASTWMAMNPGPPSRSGAVPGAGMPFGLALGAIGIGCVIAVYGLWTSRARVLTIIVVCLSLVLVPIGTIFGAGALYLLFSPAGKRLAELSRAQPRR